MLLHSTDKSVVNAFDDFFENELYQLNNEHESDDSLKLIEQYLDDATSPHITSELHIDTQQTSEATQPWRRGLWCMNEEPLVQVEKPRETRSAETFVSPTDLICSNYYNLQPSDVVIENDHMNTQTSTDTRSSAPRLPFRLPWHRDRTLSPSPAYAPTSSEEVDEHANSWQQDFQDFHLGSCREDEREVPRQEMHAQYGDQLSNISHHPFSSFRSQGPTRYHYPFQHVTRQQPSSLAKNFVTNHLSYAYQPNESSLDWTWDMHQGPSSDGSQNSSHTNSNYWGDGSQQWPASQAYRNFNSDLLAPVPLRKPHNVINQPYGWTDDASQISYPLPDQIGRAFSHPPGEEKDNGVKTIAQSQMHDPFTTYPVLPLRPGYTRYSDNGTFNQRQRSVSSSPSPSPTTSYTIANRAMPQPSPSRTGRSRRKSIHKVGPIKETTTSDLTASPTRSLSRTRSQSRSRASHGRTRSTSAKTTKSSKHSSAPVNLAFDFDFVNYTARDSEKLMSDVAPSGSSKTRARREQEARDKRHKLNEAAIFAVMEAGGDVRGLEKRLAS